METYSPSTRIDGPSQGSADAWFAWAERLGAARLPDVRQYLDTVYEFAPRANLKAEMIVTQSIHETSMSGVPWSSHWWKERCNPAGIGITGDPAQNAASRTFRNGREAALAHLVHAYLYVHGTNLPAGLSPDMDPRWDAAVGVPSIVGKKKTLGSFGSDGSTPTWAVDPQYGDKWAGWLNRTASIFEGVTPPADGGDEGRPDMAYRTVIPGLPYGPIETSFPVKLLIAPAWRTNVRPGIKARSPRFTVQHETANPNTFAVGDATYLFNGSGGRQASWHFTVDDKEAYVGIPVDEVTWQASDGSGPGNYNGVSCELAVHRDIVNNPTRRAQSQKNAAELLGRVGARLGAQPPARQHNTFAPDGKNCPYNLRTRAGEWNRYVDWWIHFRDMELAALRGETPDDQEPEVINIGDTLKTLVQLNVRQAPGTRAPVIGTLDPGAEVVVNGRWESADGYGWLPVATPLGNGAVAQGDSSGPYLEKIASAKPEEPKSDYAEVVPIPALLETDLSKYDTAEGITTDDTGNEFIFVADVIEFTAETVAARFAVDDAPQAVKAPYAAGDRAIAAWLVKNQAGTWWYVLAGGDDEWVRVPYAATKRISDAPLLGDDTP